LGCFQGRFNTKDTKDTGKPDPLCP
jgi:hypothetical protein